MTKQEMLKTIYEKIADKTPWFWLKILRKDINTEITDNWQYIYVDKDIFWDNPRFEEPMQLGLCQIIGHPVMIGDILDWWYKNSDNYLDRFCYEDFVMEIVNRREEIRLPIDQQSDECIKYVYDLVCNV